MEFQLLQVLKDDAMKVLNMPANLDVSSGHKTGKGQFSFQSQRKAMPENVQSNIHLCSFHMIAR